MRCSSIFSGLGVTFLPVRCYREEIAQGKLAIVKTSPVLPPIEFTAISAKDAIDPFVNRMARLAATISDFD
jgi:DNA-binding transcriptional LysR family regulator